MSTPPTAPSPVEPPAADRSPLDPAPLGPAALQPALKDPSAHGPPAQDASAQDPAAQGPSATEPTSHAAIADESAEPGLSYEAARTQLQQVLTALESGGQPLEESLALWRRGEDLAAVCQRWLDEATRRLDDAIADRGPAR